MKNVLGFLLLSALAAALAGCSTLKGKAEKAMQAGNFDEAVTHYEQAVADSPDDAEAVAGLKQARDEALGQRLIRVRTSRMAGNTMESLDQLLEVLDLEARWKVAPGAKAAFTQEEESGFAARAIEKQVQVALSQNYPLQASSFLRKYGRILPQGNSAKLDADITKNGKASCDQFRRSITSQTPFFSVFVSSYCQFWGESGKTKLSAGMASLLYRDLAVEMPANATEGLSSEARALAKESLARGLMKTAWYDPDGKNTVTGTLSGRFSHSHSKDATILFKTYYVQESYVTNDSVEKERQVAYETTESYFDPHTQRYSSRPVTRYRTEKYWTKEPREHTRTVERDYRYPAFRHRQSLALGLTGQFRLNGTNIDLALSEQSNDEGIEHDEDQPSKGLRPERPNLPDPNQWTRARVEKFAEDFRTRAGQLWVETYCKVSSDSDGNLAETGNQVMRCVRQPQAQPPAFVDNWHRKHLGISATEATRLLGTTRQ